MYSYCVTIASSGSTLGALKCRLVKDSDTEYLVCLKRHSIDVYSLKNVIKDNNDLNTSKETENRAPVLTATLRAHSTLIAFAEYRPPNSNQSHLLVVTRSLILILLTYDDANCKFVSRSLISMQEISCQNIASEAILRIDKGYNIIVFYGIKKVIKCIILRKNDYFNFSDLVTLRTNENFLLDIVFMNVEYKLQIETREGRDGNDLSTNSKMIKENVSSSSSRKRVDVPSSLDELGHISASDDKVFLECKLIVLTQDDVYSGNSAGDEPIRWLCGMLLFFEIECFEGSRRFNSYGCLPLFGDQIQLSNPFNKFIPLDHGKPPDRSESVLLLGSGGVGFLSFRDPKSIKIFHLDLFMSEITCYCIVEENKTYVLGDDCGNLYFMELFFSNSAFRTGLKRRVKPASGKNTSESEFVGKLSYGTVMTDVAVTKIGKYAEPSSIVHIGSNVFYSASKMGNNSTLKIERSWGSKSTNPDHEVSDNGFEFRDKDVYEIWNQTNLGPITDFTFGKENDRGSKPILACCGLGPSGRVCSISFGVGVQILCSKKLGGVRGLFSVSFFGEFNEDGAIFCCSFYNHSIFYRVTFPSNRPSSESNNVLDVVNSSAVIVSRIDPKSSFFAEDSKTVVLSRLSDKYVVQVTSTRVILISCLKGGQMVGNKTISETVSKSIPDVDFSGIKVVLANVCNDFILLLLSNHFLVLLDTIQHPLDVINWKQLPVHVSSFAFLSGGDMVQSSNSFDGLIAISTWEDCIIMLVSLMDLKVIYKKRIECNFGVAIKSMEFGVTSNVPFLFVSLTDGKLLVYKLLFTERLSYMDVAKKNSKYNCLKLLLDNVIHVSDSVIGLKVINISKANKFHRTCNLSVVNIITTGSNNSIVIYSEKGKIEYASLNIPRVSFLCGIMVPQLDSSNFGVLVAYYTKNHYLHIGELDTIERLHIQNIATGRTFDRISYHAASSVVVVGCHPELVVETCDYISNMGGNNQHKDFNKPVLMCLDASGEKTEHKGSSLLAAAKFIRVNTKEIIYNLKIPKGHLVSSICCVLFGTSRELVAIGTAKVNESHDAPTEGYIYLVDIVSSTENNCVMKIQRTVEPFDGGVVEMVSCKDSLIAAVNHKVLALNLIVENSLANKNCDNRKRYKLEHLYVCDAATEPRMYLVVDSQYISNTYIASMDSYGTSIVVGDLMTSVRLLKLEGGELREISRDFNSLWSTAVAGVDEKTCVVSDDSGNFTVFSRNTKAINDENYAKLAPVGLFHHGEIVNKIKMEPVNFNTKDVQNSLKPSKTVSAHTESPCARHFCCPVNLARTVDEDRDDDNDNTENLSESSKHWNYAFESRFTCATSSGSFMQICFFRDPQLFVRLAFVEEAIKKVQSDAGNIANDNWRDFQNSWATIPSRGFIDGDTVESFLHLPMLLRQKIFKDLSNCEEVKYPSLEALTLEIEHLKRLRLY